MKALRRIVLGLLIAEALYLASANLVLSFDFIPSLVAKQTDKVHLHWDRAWSLWPGDVNVSGFSMQLEDDAMVQLDLRVDHSTATMRLLPLLRKNRISLDHVRSQGVVYRMVTKIDASSLESSAQRLAAFPKIEGVSSPPVKPSTPQHVATHEEIDRMFEVEMTDVVADVRDLWFDEYHYDGPSHVKGAWGFHPLKELWVGPALMTLDGGKLTTGEHVLLPRFVAGIEFEIEKVSLLDAEPTVVFSTMNAALHTITEVEDLGVAGFYVDGLKLAGGGQLKLDLATHHGKVKPDSTLSMTLRKLVGSVHGFSYEGHADLQGLVSSALELKLLATLQGQLTTPVLAQHPLVVDVGTVTGELVTRHNDLSAGPGLSHAAGRVVDAKAADATPVVEAAGKFVPVIAPAVLGKGPLTGSLSVTYTSAYALLRLQEAKLGAARATGALVYNEKGWNGAAACEVGALPVGLVVDDGKLSYRPASSPEWLQHELEHHGIQGEKTAAAVVP